MKMYNKKIYIYVFILLVLLVLFYCDNRKINKLKEENLELKNKIEKKDIYNSLDSVNFNIDSIKIEKQKIDEEVNFNSLSIDSLAKDLLSD